MTLLFNYPLSKSFYASPFYASPSPITTTFSHFSVVSEQTCPNPFSKSHITFRTDGNNIGQGEGFPLPVCITISLSSALKILEPRNYQLG